MKRALITGGSSPIGQAIATEIARKGHHVLVHANSRLGAAEAIAEDIRRSGGTAEAITFDLAQPEAAREVLEALAQETPVQIVVHNAGLHRDVPFAGMAPEDWQAVIDVNLTGLYTVLRPLIMPMMRARWGRVVAISSLSGIVGNRGQANYAAAKGGMLAFAKSLTREYATRGITANVVAPGLIDTEETRAMRNLDALLSLCPAGRAGQPEDVAAAVGFLVSPEAGYISGQILAVDGGTT